MSSELLQMSNSNLTFVSSIYQTIYQMYGNQREKATDHGKYQKSFTW